jgi:hypothetical protein
MAKGQKRPVRPPAVSIIVVIFLIQVVTSVVVLWLQWAGAGMSFESLRHTAAAHWLEDDRWIDALLSIGTLLLVLASVITTIGLARMRSWAWLWAMTIQGVRLLIGLIAYFRGDPYSLAMVLQLIAVLLLDQVPVRQAFGRDALAHG